MKRLVGKVAIITGAGSGIGEASAHLFAREGASVVVAARREETCQRVADALCAAGHQAIAVAGDIGNDRDVRNLVDVTIDRFGQIDVLYNNAAMTGADAMKHDRDLVTITAETWEKVLRTNLTGPALLSRYVIPHMIAAGGGSIIFSGSARGSQSDQHYTAYAASKAGLVSLSSNIAAQYGKQGIRSNIIIVGLTMTEALRASFPAKTLSVMERHHLTPFIGAPEDIANSALYLASAESRFVTGQSHFVDGGLTSHAAHFADFLEHEAAEGK